MGSLSIWHWMIVLVVIILVFGTSKLKNVGRDLGFAVKGFKEGLQEGTSDATSAAPPQQPAQKVENAPQTPGQTIDVTAREKTGT